MNDPRTDSSPAPDETSPMSGWLIGLFLGAIDAIVLLVLGFIGLVFTLLCLGLIAWKGPRLPAAVGLVTGVGLVWTLAFVRVMAGCSANATPGSSCDPGALVPWVAAAAGVLLLGAIGTVVAARRLRGRDRH